MFPPTRHVFILIHAPLVSSLRRLFDVPNTEHEGDGDGGISKNLDHGYRDGVDEEEEEKLQHLNVPKQDREREREEAKDSACVALEKN